MLRVRVSFEGAFQGTPYLATHFWQGSTDVEATAAVAAVGQFWDDCMPLVSELLTWTTEPEVYEINVATGQPEQAFTVTPVAGQGEALSETLPIAAQGLVRWTTGFFANGRQVRGRTFIPALTQGSNDDGQLGATQQATLQAAADGLMASGDLTIYSRANLSGVIVTGASVWNQFAMLTSRRD